MNQCKNCSRKVRTLRGDDGIICCVDCGMVLDSNIYSDEATFIKGAGGQSHLAGSIVKSVQSDYSASFERTLEKGRSEIDYLATTLNIGGGDDTKGQAARFYRIAVERNFTRGRTTSLVAAACLYIVCRLNKRPFLLIDFSEELRVNVYVLGAVFLQLCQLLRLEEMFHKLVDPTLFIRRFTERLLKDKNVKVERHALNEVSKTATRIVASMKRDWMQTGRKPSGLCGAALYISAHSFGIKCSKSDIESVVHMCEATLTKRLIEFENTESGSLTVEEFNIKADELQRESEPLCKHEGPVRPIKSHGLCERCYEFFELSGGLHGGSDPPAFQRAEREKKAKASTDEKDNKSNLCEKEVEPFFQPNVNTNVNEELDSQRSEGIGVVGEGQAVEEGVSGQSNGYEGMGNVAGDESESLSDIDDVEVDGYLHNEEEKRLKTIIWEKMNREYLEEEAGKEKTAKEAYEAKFRNYSDEFLDAKELRAAAEAAVAKSRKERQQRRAAEAKNAAPARTPAEATYQMVKKKRLSSKINYDAMAKLFDDSNTKKQRTDESDVSDDDGIHITQRQEPELDFVDNDDSIGQIDDFGVEDNSRGMYGDDFYTGNEEEEEYYYGDEF